MKAMWLTLYAIVGFGSWSCAGAQLSPQNWPAGPCEFSESDPFAAAKKCKVKADAGDPAAMYQFSTMLLNFAPDPFRSPRQEIRKWKAVGDKYAWSKWLDLAATRGNQVAIRVKCEMSKDPSASEGLRNEGPKWCARITESANATPAEAAQEPSPQ